jgi:hypothetical protein
MAIILCGKRYGSLAARFRVQSAFMRLTSFAERGFSKHPSRLWIILLMNRPFAPVGNRSESQTGRGIRRVNRKYKLKINKLFTSLAECLAAPAFQPFTTPNCA